MSMEQSQEADEPALPCAVTTEPYTPKPAEEAALASLEARKAKTPRVRFKILEKDNTPFVDLDHPAKDVGWPAAMASLGTTSYDFVHGLLVQVANATGANGKLDEDGINFAFAAINGIGPRDEVETMLAAQMAATHMATMAFASRLARAENPVQREGAERAFNKLARTFTTQVEGLKRYRSDGRQTVRVERVTVEAGGQAIVGAVSPRLEGGARDGE